MRKRSFIYLYVMIFVIVFLVSFFLVQFLTKTGIFRIPGAVYYDESLNSEELTVLKEIFTEDVELDKDVYISAKEILELPGLQVQEYLYEVYLPVTEFTDNTHNNINIDSAEEIYDPEFQKENNFKVIPAEELNFSQKLLSINHKYYLDEFNEGAVYRVIEFESEKFLDEIEPLVSGEFTKEFPESESVLTFAQTGVTALSRRMNTKLHEVDGDGKHFAEKIGEYLSSFDLTHTSNEASFSEYASGENICSDPRFMDTLINVGLDIVELTGNHNQDCGDEAARKTIDIYNNNRIKIVGGGKTADEAKEPLKISQKNTEITFLAFNQSTGGATLDDTPGANQYYENVVEAQIAEAKARQEFVIVDIQYYECAAYASEYEDPTCDYADSAAGDQVGFFRHLIDLGADMVVGTSAHQPQTYELYKNGVIYYGLGNLFFDQTWWPGTTRSLILSHYFYNNKLLQTKIVPTVYDDNMQTEIMSDAEWFLDRLVSAQP